MPDKEKNMTDIFLNGRFLVQSLSGVQRFALEMTRALNAQWPASLEKRALILTPHSDQQAPADLPVKACGSLKGQLWEQISLPAASRSGLLVNLGNTGPVLPALFGRRQIVVIHDAGVFSTPQSYSWKFRLYYKILHKLLAMGKTRIVTVSEFARQDIARHLKINPARISVITEGADHAIRTPEDASILSRHDLQPGQYVLAVGNKAPHKDFAALGHLASTLAEKGVQLVISGGMNSRVFGENAPDLSHATYVGRVSDEELRALYSHAACFVFPSIYEGFGLPPVEAMKCGCPVVARDIPVLREVCEPAALFGSTPQDLTAQVVKILDDTALADTLREQGKQHAERYRWDIAAARLLAVIQQEAAKC